MVIVVTCGCFDGGLHPGHVQCLKDSSELGEKFIVLLNSDEWIRKNKREPIFNQEERKYVLEAMGFIDEVIIFDTNKEKDKLLRDLKPDIFTKTSKCGEYSDLDKILETPTMKEIGGKVVILQSKYPHCSTTNVVKKLMNEYNEE
jgi:rfaE bifunctional protein nucleotidyltransferase chain/domain